MVKDVDFGFGFRDLPKYLQRLKYINIVVSESFWLDISNNTIATFDVHLGDTEQLFYERVCRELAALEYPIKYNDLKKAIQSQYNKKSLYYILKEDHYEETVEYEFFFDLTPIRYKRILLECSFK